MAKARITFIMEYELIPENYLGCRTVEDMFELEKYYLKEYPETFLKTQFIKNSNIELVKE